MVGVAELAVVVPYGGVLGIWADLLDVGHGGGDAGATAGYVGITTAEGKAEDAVGGAAGCVGGEACVRGIGGEGGEEDVEVGAVGAVVAGEVSCGAANMVERVCCRRRGEEG